ncbi:MAG: prepilin-type N-terminal cleavage/methylation domain-containing protein [Gemmatimonadota bacterium]
MSHGARRSGFTVIELLAVVTIIGLLSAIGIPKLGTFREKAKIARAIGDIHAIQTDLTTADTLPDDLGVINRAAMLDPWGRPYVYNKFPQNRVVPPGARRDRFLVPINTEFDLYTLGQDGQSNPPLQASASQDDVVRGNDGGFIGLATKF